MWGERNNSLYLTNRKFSEFVDGEVNFADCSSTARADCFFDLFVRLYDDRNNKQKDVSLSLFRSLVNNQWISNLHLYYVIPTV